MVLRVEHVMDARDAHERQRVDGSGVSHVDVREGG
jgi:hypothetical protein